MIGHMMIGRRRLPDAHRSRRYRRPRSAACGTRAGASPPKPSAGCRPRGTVEVLDDYPYWVAKKFGYFGDIETTLEPGPSDATATVKLVDQDQADMGYPSPGVFSLGARAGHAARLGLPHGRRATCSPSPSARARSPPASRTSRARRSCSARAGWQSICDPMLKAAGVDITKVKYVEAGWPTWGTALMAGQGDAALSWEGLRAQWKGQGLDFDYWLGRDFSKLPANSFVIRKADFDDAGEEGPLCRYFQGWAMGLEFGRHQPARRDADRHGAVPGTCLADDAGRRGRNR